MKKNLWILGFAAASLMAGCSSNDDVLSSLQGQPDADINAGIERRRHPFARGVDC